MQTVLFRQNNQWQLCTHKVTFISHGEEDVQYTGDVQWYKDFEQKWDTMKIVSIEDVTFSEEEKTRFEKIKDLPEDFNDVYSHYILTGELNEENFLPKNHPFLIIILEDKNNVMKTRINVLEDKTKNSDQIYKETDINSVSLEELKALKMAQLTQLCQEDIYNGFYAEVDGVTYFFSFDTEAQANFTGSVTTLATGLIKEVPQWTVKLNGVYSRIKMTIEQFNHVALTGLIIKDQKIARLRNELEPKVHLASTNEAVNAITW